MNKNKFRKKLEEYAEVIDLKPSLLPGQRSDEFTEVVIDHETIELGAKFNPTLGIVVKFKDRLALCNLGCGQTIINQVINSAWYAKPYPHWRQKCSVCKKLLHPSGKGLIASSKQAYNSYLDWFEKEKNK